MKTELIARALEADFEFSKALRRWRLDRWSDSTQWPEDVRTAFEAKRAADRKAFNEQEKDGE